MEDDKSVEVASNGGSVEGAGNAKEGVADSQDHVDQDTIDSTTISSPRDPEETSGNPPPLDHVMSTSIVQRDGSTAGEDTVGTETEAEVAENHYGTAEALSAPQPGNEEDDIERVAKETTIDNSLFDNNGPNDTEDDLSLNRDDSLGSQAKVHVLKQSVTTDEGAKEVTLHIINDSFRKPYLGGFRNKLTGIEYHNASAQTFPKLPIIPQGERFHRDTQTVSAKSKIQQTFNDTSTQMTKIGCYVSDATDKILIPGQYVTADEVAEYRLKKIILLQTHWRRWLATQYVKKLRADKIQRIAWERAEQMRKEREREERVSKEYRQRTNPKTKEDFDLLYSALEKWRIEEIEKINETRTGAERKAALAILLEQEAYLIQSIERHKIEAKNAYKADGLKKFLDKAAQPKKWRSHYDGKYTEMDTPNTLRAQQLGDLYSSLQMSYLTTDERLDILLTLKQVVKEHDCKLTQEIVELIDRETDLLTRGVKNDRLHGLRQRIITLFLQYCKTPLFNPEIASLLKVPQDSSTIRKDIFFCPSCNSYLPSSDFSTASNSRIIGRCIKCSKIDNDARLRQDFSKFRNMLRRLRQEEETYSDGSKVAFYIQDSDFHYLIENIWNGQSCLSAWDDLHDLVILRWNKHEEWTPWNCILLTKDEAQAHLKLNNVNEAYGRIFVGKIHHRHVVAKTHFSKLREMTKKKAIQEKPKILDQVSLEA